MKEIGLWESHWWHHCRRHCCRRCRGQHHHHPYLKHGWLCGLNVSKASTVFLSFFLSTEKLRNELNFRPIRELAKFEPVDTTEYLEQLDDDFRDCVEEMQQETWVVLEMTKLICCRFSHSSKEENSLSHLSSLQLMSLHIVFQEQWRPVWSDGQVGSAGYKGQWLWLLWTAVMPDVR